MPKETAGVSRRLRKNRFGFKESDLFGGSQPTYLAAAIAPNRLDAGYAGGTGSAGDIYNWKNKLTEQSSIKCSAERRRMQTGHHQ